MTRRPKILELPVNVNVIWRFLFGARELMWTHFHTQAKRFEQFYWTCLVTPYKTKLPGILCIPYLCSKYVATRCVSNYVTHVKPRGYTRWTSTVDGTVSNFISIRSWLSNKTWERTGPFLHAFIPHMDYRHGRHLQKRNLAPEPSLALARSSMKYNGCQHTN
jgi:hypothetical protein